MITRLALSSILAVICVVAVNSAKVKSKIGPSGMGFHETTNCSTFSKFGRFNPYSVLHEKWFVFFYWAHPRPLTTFIFTFPTANHTKHLKKILDGNTILPVMWSARQILMEDQDKEVSLLVERGDRGEYWWYPLYKVKKGGTKISPRDVRLKQTGDNRILGFMDCADETLLVMARMNDVPPKNRLQEEASRLGYRGRRGKSYLYQGHEWVPIPEDDEKNYWEYSKEKKNSPSKEVLDQSIKELPVDETNKNNEEEKPETHTQVTINEEELKERCDKIEPVLWNDPKPEPVTDPDKIPISSDELNNGGTYLLEDTQTIEATENDIAINDLTKNLITENEISENEITKDEITENLIGKNEIHNNEITEDEITNNIAAKNTKKANQEISKNEFNEDQITKNITAKNEIANNEISENEITEDEITKNMTTKNEIANNEISKNEITEDVITKNTTANNEIANNEISENKITEDEITKNMTTKNEIANNEISENKITEDEITKNTTANNETANNEISENKITKTITVKNETANNETAKNEISKNERGSVKESKTEYKNQNYAQKSPGPVEKKAVKQKNKKSKKKKPANDSCDTCFEMRVTDDADLPADLPNHSSSNSASPKSNMGPKDTRSPKIPKTPNHLPKNKK